MVLALEGGYGTARILHLIDWDAVGDPRIVCGYSDLTALHLALQAHLGWGSFYGPMLLRFTRKRKDGSPRTPRSGFTVRLRPSRSAGSSRTPTTRTCSRSARAWPRARWWAAA